MNKREKINIRVLRLLSVLLSSAALFSACATTGSRSATAVYRNIPEGTPVRLGRLELSPAYILEGMKPQLPDIIYSCLEKSGLPAAERQQDAAVLDVFIHSKTWNNNYSPCESVTITLKLSFDGTTAFYHLLTVDTGRSIDSFSLTLKMLEDAVSILAEKTGYEKQSP